MRFFGIFLFFFSGQIDVLFRPGSYEAVGHGGFTPHVILLQVAMAEDLAS